MLQSDGDRRDIDVRAMLSSVGLRPTRQRIALVSLLLGARNHRITAEILYDETRRARCPVSRATVCNTLRKFEHAGFLRRISIRRSKRAWFAVDYRIIDSFA